MEYLSIEEALKEFIYNLERDNADKDFIEKIKSLTIDLRLKERKESALIELRYLSRVLDLIQLEDKSLIIANKILNMVASEIK